MKNRVTVVFALIETNQYSALDLALLNDFELEQEANKYGIEVLC